MKLSEQEKTHINHLATQFEASTGVQLLAVVAGKSDTYPEIPWKAFAIGTSLSALALTAIISFRSAWAAIPHHLSITIILCTGLAWALASIFLRPVARLFLGKARAVAETTQYAQALFLERDLGRTRSRTAILFLVSQLERRAAMVADRGITGRISNIELDKIRNETDAILAREGTSAALDHGLLALKNLLLAGGFTAGAGGNEIPGEFLETGGPES